MAEQEASTRLQVSEWVIGIVGAIAAFLGVYVLVGGENQSIGIGGTVSWQVSEISPWWGVGLVVAGIVAGGLVVWMRRGAGARGSPTAAVDASRADLFVHATVFALVNAFVWVQDLVIGDGVNYAYWITLPWAVGLGVHAISLYTHEHRDPLAH
jgi:hypothetical protein